MPAAGRNERPRRARATRRRTLEHEADSDAWWRADELVRAADADAIVIVDEMETARLLEVPAVISQSAA